MKISLPSSVFQLIRFLTLSSLIAASALAQTSTGTIGGSVVDSSGAVIAGAEVSLANESTKDTRLVQTDSNGGFNFPAVQPGTYTVRVEITGFRSFERNGNVLTASDRLSVGSLELTIGAVGDAVTVTAQGAAVQSASSERSALVTAKQVETIGVRGRDVVSLLRLLPGSPTRAIPNLSALVTAAPHRRFKERATAGTLCQSTD